MEEYLEQTLEKQEQEIGQIEYIHKTKNLFFPKELIMKIMYISRRLKFNKQLVFCQNLLFTTGEAYLSIFRIS